MSYEIEGSCTSLARDGVVTADLEDEDRVRAGRPLVAVRRSHDPVLLRAAQQVQDRRSVRDVLNLEKQKCQKRLIQFHYLVKVYKKLVNLMFKTCLLQLLKYCDKRD